MGYYSNGVAVLSATGQLLGACARPNMPVAVVAAGTNNGAHLEIPPSAPSLPCLQIFYHILHKPCSVDSRGLLVDVGGNFGWFSVFSAMMGCRWGCRLPARPGRSFRVFSCCGARVGSQY